MVPIPCRGVIERDHVLHEYLSDVLVFSTAVYFAAARGHTLPEPFVIRFACTSGHADLRLVSLGHEDAILTGELPGAIEIFIALKDAPPEHSITAHGITGPHQRFACAIFSLFVERCCDWIKNNLTTNYHDWPPVANFCRVVRNAIAHGGTIDINSERAPVVSWRELTYGHLQRGRAIINTGADLSTGDLLLLMLELSDEMDSIGATELH